MTTKEEVYKACTVTGNIVKLPPEQLVRKLYMEVAKGLELIGGRWNRKEQGFVFTHDPSELLEQLASGQKRDLKKEYQYFETPEDIADWMVELANLNMDDEILEPEAGQGAIIKAIARKNPIAVVDCYELMDINRTFLAKVENANIIGEDFLSAKHVPKYTAIIANPPFSKNQDIDHVRAMWDCLLPGGRIITIMSKHWQMSSNKKETEFREWLDKIEATTYPIESGGFKSSGTMVEATIVEIYKPK